MIDAPKKTLDKPRGGVQHALMRGRELLRMLEEAGMTRRQLGRELGIADTTIGRWIKEETPLGPVEAMGLTWYFETQHGIKTRWKAFAS